MIPYILYFSHYSLIDAKHSNQVVFVTDDLFVRLNVYYVSELRYQFIIPSYLAVYSIDCYTRV